MEDLDFGAQPHCPDDDVVMRDVPGGWDIAKVPPVLNRDGTFTADAMIGRRDDVREIEADDMDTLQSKVPDGWQMLSVRKI
ncbi:hypothetical protein ACTU6V_13835 [Microbacterium sp. A204]|uniref:hypothetical protein n=1 Tax=Microbacterium sp. A204 TaxID=3457321 RepID=UPI003FD36C75